MVLLSDGWKGWVKSHLTVVSHTVPCSGMDYPLYSDPNEITPTQ